MNFEDELLLDAELDAQEVSFISEHLSTDAAGLLTEDDLYYFIDLLASYYAESGLLDAEPDADGYIDLPMDAIVEYLQKTAHRELGRDFDSEILQQVIEFDMAFAEMQEQE